MVLMKFCNQLKKSQCLCCILAILVFIGFIILMYNNKKYNQVSNMNNSYQSPGNNKVQYQEDTSSHSGETSSIGGAPLNAPPAMPAGFNSFQSRVDDVSSYNKQSTNPSDLLPNDPNNAFAMGMPTGQGELANINLLKAGQLAGINTVGGTLRNANLQLRSEPPNPRAQVSPWSNSTIEPDLMRIPLELGCGPQ